MSFIKSIRDYYGISQEDLAAYLSVTRTSLSMAEVRAERLLPTAAMLKLNRMEPTLLPTTTESMRHRIGERQQKQMEAAAVQLQRTAKDRELQLYAARKKLVEMQIAEQRAIHTLQLVSASPDQSASEKDKILLRKLETDAWASLDRGGKAAQKIVELKIKMLEYEIGIINHK